MLPSGTRRWGDGKALLDRAHPNVAIVAFANQLANFRLAALRRGETFVAGRSPAAA